MASTQANRPFPSCFEPHFQSEAKCKVFIMKISFHSNANKSNFHMKRFALSLAFIMRFAVYSVHVNVHLIIILFGHADGKGKHIRVVLRDRRSKDLFHLIDSFVRMVFFSAFVKLFVVHMSAFSTGNVIKQLV